MFACLFHKLVVRNPISTLIIRNTHHPFINYYSSISQIHENPVLKDSSLRTKNIDNTPSITELLKSYDFTDSQIVKFFTKFPPKSSLKSTKLIKTNLDFFLNAGFSNTQLAKFISVYPCLAATSLEKRLKPNILLLRPIYQTEKQLVHALSLTYDLLQTNLETNFFPNIKTLTNHGVPHNNILKLANKHPKTLLRPRKQFNEKLRLIASMGFDPCSPLFCTGLYAILATNCTNWTKKVSIFKTFGWLEEDVVSAFTKQPFCMLMSEDNIKRSMDFYVSKMHLEPSILAKNLVLLTLSLEKRVIPRLLVMDILLKEELITRSGSVASYLKISNKVFLEKYVMPFQDKAPELLRAYHGNLDSECTKKKYWFC